MPHLQISRASRRAVATPSAPSTKRRPMIGLAAGAAILAAVAAGIVYAPAALGAVPSETALEEAADAVEDGKLALVNAQALNTVVLASEVQPGSVATAVDFVELRSNVNTLSDTDGLSADRVAELTAAVDREADAVQGRTSALQNALTTAKEMKVAEDARLKAEAERIAAEKAAKKAAEDARRAAEAQAAANTPEGAKATARAMAAERYGWGEGEFSCLVSLWTKESGWDYQAYNPNGGATGIPQSLPGDKMATAGSDWRTNATTQISWGLDYIQRAYGSPCAAWGHSQAVNWY
ncbi:phospholipase [Microbacterium esteraromaticum]|uniref:Phospholipase n=1 Tax=Microbacterium esteraromaticum TaxID=57043 RepID=A0A939IV26_9MICO|nr:phospholipase [Microbacterium esteraromaticum]MBN8205629.1 phospholipase [Microbacterium esteraromaticum]MBN8415783.1 phospholipase [Microbacterium esteraromaticum]